jgi:hypothetical protein
MSTVVTITVDAAARDALEAGQRALWAEYAQLKRQPGGASSEAVTVAFAQAQRLAQVVAQIATASRAGSDV